MRIIDGAHGTGDNCFFSYNHDFEHPYFAPRPGFVRGSVKYQGMVGVLGKRGKTRLTWLVNFDFGGLIPPSFGSHFLIGIMPYPAATIETLREDKERSVQKTDGDARGESGGDDAEIKTSLSTSAMLDRIARLEAQRKEDVAALRKKDELLEEKDRLLEVKEKQMVELRRRLPRVVEKEV